MFLGQASLATSAVAPVRSAVKVPDDVPLEQPGPLACGVITCAGSVIEALRLRPGDSIVVLGPARPPGGRRDFTDTT
ncbi:hypothetical protein GCM10022403_086220 [Streptomyces coacervatus]|uniref:RCK C-terminal domain-containing protein n=1 Tax=Streptomyces coacervatus TaxID=647381 RepID=A0ABP7JE20_9ACTN|nr:hypothetical protein [Streptomyces coacervatus]MDF2264235.1 hypothetical protein [Streptomyces coacervatus]